MKLADRWDVIVGRLPNDWTQASLTLDVDDPARADRAALLLGGLTPGRLGSTFRFATAAAGRGAPSPDAVRRALAQLDEEGIGGRVALEGSSAEARAATASGSSPSLAGQWDALAAKLPPDWSDALLEVELDSSADVERGALLLGPVNPFLQPGTSSFRFRAASRFGYGAAPQMVRRSFERLDEEPIHGRLSVVRVLSDTRPASSQGPVWRIGRRAV